MRKIRLVDNSTKITSRENSSVGSSKIQISKNIEEKINHIKNLKKLFLSSPNLLGKNDSNANININIKTVKNEELAIKNALQKKKKANFTANKFYHSSLASISYSPKIFNKKRIKKIKTGKNENNKDREKIVFLKLNNKNYREVIKDNLFKFDKFKKEYKKININNFSTNNENITSIPSITKNTIEKKIKKSFSNNELDYMRYINKKNLRLNNLRKKKKENVTYISSNAITNESLNKYENKKSTKIKNKLQIYSFKDIINDLTRNVNLVNISNSKEFNLQLLRKLEEKKVKEMDKINSLNSYNYMNNYKNNYTKNKKKGIIEANLIELVDDINFKEIISFDGQDDYQINQNGYQNNFFYDNYSNKIRSKLLLKEEKEKEENAIKEELKILGDSNSNKINWQLINKEEIQKGKKQWKKILKLTKDFGINCNMNQENKIDDLNSDNETIKPKLNLNIKNICFPEDNDNINQSRKTIVLKQTKELQPVKINSASPITSNNIFKRNKKFNLNEKLFNKKNINNNNKISSTSKIRTKKTNYNNISSKVKLKNIKNKEEPKSETPSNIIMKEETKSIDKNINNNKIKEIEENKEEETNINNVYDSALGDKINELLENPYLFYAQRLNKENSEEEKEGENTEENKENEYEREEEEEEKEDKKENKKEIEKDDNNTKKEIKYKKIERKSEVQDISIFQRNEYNHQIALNHLKSPKKKTNKIRPSFYSFIDELRNSKKSSQKDQNSEKRKSLKYFNNIDVNSINEINKRKLEVLFKFKNDLDFKIMKGHIKSNEFSGMENLEQKINVIKIKNPDSNSNKKYVYKLEEYFTAYEKDVNVAENKNKNEERLNRFRNDLIHNINLSENIRENREKRLANAIDFSDVNRINKLSRLNKNKI